MQRIDLNCDMGEGMPGDALIMPYITSANIACGYHAGDDDMMKKTIQLALLNNVAIGAHPSFNDRKNFGRTEMMIGNDELYDLVSIQVQRLKNIAASFEVKLHHVKPHGALYNMAAKDAGMSSIIAKAIKDIDHNLVLYGLSNSHLLAEAKNTGLNTAAEVFADRTYTDEGNLTPRSQPGALIEDEERSLQQVLQMVMENKVTTVSGKIIPIEAQTICIHGDGTHAPAFAKNIQHALKQNNIEIKAI
jgi:5-oxoprolinase (ATP-hydrolysing) subunit A